ncbi:MULTISPECIES: hypothetical protein [Ralstonia]|jgi:hypothetical protein|uniref:Uncharacterized protein n=1 Tax=Ralstonia pickettii OR214 TaxID=1264675 RepID=R0CSX8_RALPI|nr:MULTISPECIES: hypothetical protein [Ralstonia]ENZ79646.1 hypothetical protein OR214_00063 [Ralstonia pickettii OR214]MBL4778391.1 hypothetical protein [Ralstonia sp.]
MNGNTNYLISGGVSLSAGTVVETVNWLAGIAFKTQLPPGVASLFATLAIAGAHAVLNRISAKSAAKSAAPAQ